MLLLYSLMRKLKWKSQNIQYKQNMDYDVSNPINIAKAVSRGKFIISNAFITKQEQKKRTRKQNNISIKKVGGKNLIKVKAETVKLSR